MPVSGAMETEEYFRRHPVFAWEAFRREGEGRGLSKTALAERIKYALERGRLKPFTLPSLAL